MNNKDQNNPLALLEPWLNDPDVLEIMVDSYDRVYVEKGGQLVDVSSPFRDNQEILDMINAIASRYGRLIVNASTPMLDARLPDGSRMNVVIPPISLLGPALTIRKFPPLRFTLEDLVGWNTISADMVAFLRACVHGRLNIIVAGGTGSGKTTMMNLVAGMIPADERIVTIESAAELQLPASLKRVIPLESRPSNMEGQGEISVRDLVINALRMRPDRIITGEVRGSEVLDLLQAMNTGHDGCMMTLHANSPRDVLARVETMVTLSFPSIPLLSVREMMASAIDLIMYQERMRDGSRKVLKITEVSGLQGDNIALRDIFEFRQTGVQEGRIAGRHTATGQFPGFLSRIREAGIELPMGLFTPN